MAEKTVTLKVPTKVMLAGEFGVLLAGGQALAVATWPGFDVGASTDSRWRVFLPDLREESSASTVAGVGEVGAMGLVRQALQEALRLWPALPPLSLCLTSHPQRLPVGASASLVAGTLLAARAVMGSNIPIESLLGPAIRAHGMGQGSGSGYDVATVLLGGAVHCHMNAQNQLAAGRTNLAGGWEIVVAEVGESSATGQSIGRVIASAGSDDAIREHQKTSSRLILELTAGSRKELLVAAIAAANATLARLDELSGGHIITPAVQRALVAGAPFPVRVSGAGGGDLVVGFVDSAKGAEQLCQQWQAAGFRTRRLVC